MRRQISIVLLLLLLCAPFALAEITLVDGSNGQELTHAIVSVTIGASTTEYLVLPGQRLNLPVEQEQSELDIRTNFSDAIRYTAIIAANDSPKTVIVHAAGVLLLQAKDDRDNFVAHAPVSIRCSSAQANLQTDASGILRVVLPAGDCLVSVAARGRTGSASLRIVQGENLNAVLALNGTAVEAKDSSSSSGILFWVIFWFVLLVVVLAIALIVLRKRMPKPADTNTTSATPSLLSKEQMIVDALLSRKGKATLSELRTTVRLPRTSLLRTLEGLERRSVLVKKEEHGKVIIELLKK